MEEKCLKNKILYPIFKHHLQEKSLFKNLTEPILKENEIICDVIENSPNFIISDSFNKIECEFTKNSLDQFSKEFPDKNINIINSIKLISYSPICKITPENKLIWKLLIEKFAIPTEDSFLFSQANPVEINELTEIIDFQTFYQNTREVQNIEFCCKNESNMNDTGNIIISNKKSNENAQKIRNEISLNKFTEKPKKIIKKSDFSEETCKKFSEYLRWSMQNKLLDTNRDIENEMKKCNIGEIKISSFDVALRENKTIRRSFESLLENKQENTKSAKIQ